MSPRSPGAPPGKRVVMLVDNAVDGDSRVQKSARTAAEYGWDVTLIGKSPDKRRHTWFIGNAQVLLIPVPSALRRRRHSFRHSVWRRPLAYPPGPIARYRRRRVQAWRADLQVRRLAENRSLLPARIAARLADRWVRLRVRHTELLKQARRRQNAPIDRIAAALWQRLMGHRSWRRLEPSLWDYELAYGPVVDELRPDLIHANDFRMLGVGARAKLWARLDGRRVGLVWDAHEFLPGIKPRAENPRWLPGQCAHEREYAPHADAVVTVSETLGDLLAERHGLAEPPTVVLNAPAVRTVEEPAHGLRELCGIGPDAPLAVYSGAAASQRGLDIMVEALPRIGDLHVALVVPKPDAPYVAGLLDRAAELGVSDRVHAQPYVPCEQIVPFLATADLGVIPIHHWPNHEIALITKFFEYSHARLPLVVSDVRTMAGVTRATGQGEVFTAQDTGDYVRAVRAVLADPGRYRDAYDKPGLLDEWTWEAQAALLRQVYARVLT